MISQKKKIEDVCNFVGGSQPPKSVFISTPKEGYIRLIQTRDYKTESFKTYIPKHLARKFCSENDIMIGRYGPPIFQICRGLKGAYNVALLKAIPNENIEREYLYYFLKQGSVFKYVDGLSLRTGGQTGVDIGCLNKYPIFVPCHTTQKKIATVLSALDAKIKLNNRINVELEAMAKTLYDYWFVQFDFPISKEQAKAMGKPELTGKPYKSSGGKMVYNETLKREIPEGWEDGTLGEVGVNIKNGVKSTDIDPKTAYIGLEHIPRKKIVLDIWSRAVDITSNKSVFNKRDILFGKLRPYFHKVGIAFVAGVCSTDILVLNSEDENDYGLFAMVVSNDDFIQYVSSGMEGTRMPRTKWEFMKKYSFAIPDDENTNQFNTVLKHILPQMEVNVYQNQQLAQLRDWLLPMLMNGQVTVK